LDGTRTYLVGERSLAVIDPGPDVREHVRALVVAAAGAERVRILLTHGHPDHAAAARPLADRLGAEVFGPAMPGVVDRVLADGDSVDTDHGALIAVHTPGHTEDHLCFHMPSERALFAGDLLLGTGDTTWVAEYSGCVADYFDSLERLRHLALEVIYPGHGPPLEDPADAIDRFERHRRERVRQVQEALAALSTEDMQHLLDLVYGDTVPPGLHGAAIRSLGALVDYVKGVRRS
jgi:glyoxylase-like metal-dependent hydrolase (beta-lactamase superfamily II)